MKPAESPKYLAAVAAGRVGRPRGCETYDREVADLICDRLSHGEALIQICRDVSMPSVSTVVKWIYMDIDGFAIRYARARDSYAEVRAEEALEIASKSDNEHYCRDRLYLDTLKWYLAKMVPRKWADKLPVELTGPGGGPVQVERPEPRELARRVALLLTQSAEATAVAPEVVEAEPRKR